MQRDDLAGSSFAASQWLISGNSRCAGHATAKAVATTRISTQVRFRKEEELKKNAEALAKLSNDPALSPAASANVKILTSCPSCLQGLSRFGNDLNNGLLEADYIVVEMANQILGDQWMPDYVKNANQGGIERVLV